MALQSLWYLTNSSGYLIKYTLGRINTQVGTNQSGERLIITERNDLLLVGCAINIDGERQIFQWNSL